MVEYLCITCKRLVPHTALKKRVKCPYCGGKIFIKLRPKIVKHVKAR